MANQYFNYTNQLARFTTADAVRLNATIKAVEAGFDKLPTPSELNQGSRNYAVATNTGNAYSVTVPFTLTSYSSGLQLTFLAAQANTGSATLNANNVGPATIRRFDGANLLEGDIRAASLNTVVFDGTSFRITSMHGGTETLVAASAAAAASSASSAAVSASDALTSKNSAMSSASSASASAASAASIVTGARFGFRNILLNPFFWVNHRRPGVFNETTGAGFYIRDRWKTGAAGATWSIANSIMTITAGSVLQIVSSRNIHITGTYTLSWTGTSTARVNGVSVANGGQVTLTSYQNVTVEFLTGTFSHAQLEYGGIKTPLEVRSTDIELLMCAQYYQRSYPMDIATGALSFDGVFISITRNTSQLFNGQLLFQTRMRTLPTITTYSPQTGLSGRIWMSPTADIVVDIANPSQIGFYIISNAGAFIADKISYLQWTADADI